MEMVPQIAAAMLLICLLGGCASTQKIDGVYQGETPYTIETDTIKRLKNIPSLGQPQITIAVYDFPDRTGQRKPNVKFSQLSTAVTQGPETWVINGLKAVGGNEPWFIVLEREGLDNLVKERQLIRSTRELYDGESDVKNQLKPLKFAGLIVEGGIVGYDSNITSGGVGARYFGIGLSEQYRTDQVTVSLRLVAVQTGEIVLTVSATKTIASYSSGGDVFRFLDMSTKALEIETGVATNEPVNYAIRTTIEHAIFNMIHEGIVKDLWQFKIEE
tara:strand:+ start:584 stop:1402 length:819 start_codon:yes stop_codon:yes gene_type:complete